MFYCAGFASQSASHNPPVKNRFRAFFHLHRKIFWCAGFKKNEANSTSQHHHITTARKERYRTFFILDDTTRACLCLSVLILRKFLIVGLKKNCFVQQTKLLYSPIPEEILNKMAEETSTVEAALKIIDWEEAMTQVGGDEEFLNEVLQDLLTESATAEQEIGDAIGTSDFSGVMKAAHRIKGSASYLCCEALRDISLKLQDAGHEGTASPKDPEQLLDKIKTLFDKFVQCLKDLKAEIEARENNK